MRAEKSRNNKLKETQYLKDENEELKRQVKEKTLEVEETLKKLKFCKKCGEMLNGHKHSNNVSISNCSQYKLENNLVNTSTFKNTVISYTHSFDILSNDFSELSLSSRNRTKKKEEENEAKGSYFNNFLFGAFFAFILIMTLLNSNGSNTGNSSNSNNLNNLNNLKNMNPERTYAGYGGFNFNLNLNILNQGNERKLYDKQEKYEEDKKLSKEANHLNEVIPMPAENDQMEIIEAIKEKPKTESAKEQNLDIFNDLNEDDNDFDTDKDKTNYNLDLEGLNKHSKLKEYNDNFLKINQKLDFLETLEKVEKHEKLGSFYRNDIFPDNIGSNTNTNTNLNNMKKAIFTTQDTENDINGQCYENELLK